jgi:hypothetical protein
MLGPDALTTLNTNYSGVLVGAKGFKPPEGLGMFSSQDCYIGLLRPGRHSIIDDRPQPVRVATHRRTEGLALDRSTV